MASLMKDNVDADGPRTMQLRNPHVDVGKADSWLSDAPIPGTPHDGRSETKLLKMMLTMQSCRAKALCCCRR